MNKEDKMSSIDFSKVDKAFQSLADTKEGNASLEQLRKALDNVASSVNPQLNEQEARYLVNNLVQQRVGGFSAGILKEVEGARKVSTFILKTSVN